jgi:hypothetical protein
VHKKKKRGRDPIVSDAQIQTIVALGGDWPDLMKRGMKELSAKARMNQWMKLHGHPRVDHPEDKRRQIAEVIPALYEITKDRSKLVIYESHAGHNGGCTRMYRTSGGTVIAQTFDDKVDCVPKFKIWAEKNPRVMLDVVDIDPYEPTARMFESGILDRLKPDSLLFYTLPRCGPYARNRKVRKANARVFGCETPKPTDVQATLVRLLAKRGIQIRLAQILDLGTKRGGVYRMAFVCSPVTKHRHYDRNQANPLKIAQDIKTKIKPAIADMPLEHLLVGALKIVRKCAITGKGHFARDMLAESVAEAFDRMGLAAEAIMNLSTDHETTAAEGLKTYLASAPNSKLDRALALLKEPEVLPAT